MKVEIRIGTYLIQMFSLGNGKVRIALVDQRNFVVAYTDQECNDLTLAVKLVTGEK